MPKYGWGAVTVPGVTSGWAEINKRFGKLSLSQILEPAASYARDGFPVSPVVSALWNRLAESFKKELSPRILRGLGQRISPWRPRSQSR